MNSNEGPKKFILMILNYILLGWPWSALLFHTKEVIS